MAIYVDADACPVKQEVYRVAQRYGLDVTLVANSWMNVPGASWLKLPPRQSVLAILLAISRLFLPTTKSLA